MSAAGQPRRRRNELVVILIGVLFTATPVLSQAPAGTLVETDDRIAALVLEAQRMVETGRAAEAQTLLAAREAEYAGSPLYDYWLGVALLDAGAPRDAAFALERVVATEPDFTGARMELGRAYYALDEFDAAREQFDWLLEQSPPPSTRTVIERYLAAIETAGGALESRISGLLQFGSGYDSNANASTDSNAFLGFTLSPANVEVDSGFAELLAGIGHSLAIGRAQGLVTRAQLSQRWYPDASFVDQSVVGLSSEFVQRLGEWRWSIGASGRYGWLDADEHDWSADIELGAARRLATNWELAFSARGGVQQYDDERLHVLDVDRYLGAVSMTRLALGDNAGRLGLALLAGRDETRRDGSPYGNDRAGVRVFGGVLLRPQASLYAEIAWLRTDYGDNDFFGATREDEQYSAQVSVDIQNWPVTRWSVSPRVRYVQNDSDVSLYEYDRFEAAVYIRRAF